MPRGFFSPAPCCDPGSGGSSSGGSGASTSASYVTVTAEPGLSQERFISASIGLLLSDGGAGAALALRINDGVVATLTGSRFTGPVVAAGGLSGSLQQLAGGGSFLVAGSNVTITSASNGQVVIASTGGPGGGGGADPGASYVVLGLTASLANERALAAGTGILIVDGGSGGSVTVGANDGVLAALPGSRFSGPVRAAGGLSGSLQQLDSGASYLVAGPNVTVSSASSGQVTVSAAAGADPGATYLVLSTTASLPNERALVAGTGVLLADGGAGTGLTASINNNVVATVSGSRFTGAVTFAAGLSGSLTALADGTPYVRAGRGMTTTTGSNGSVTVSVSASLSLVDGQVEEHYALDVGIKNAGVSSTSNNNMAALGYLSTGGTDGQWRFNANPPSGYLGGSAIFRSYFSLTGSGISTDHAQFSVGVASFNIGNNLGSFTNFNAQVELGGISSDTMQAFDVVLPQTFFTGSKSVLLFNLIRNRFATPGQDTYDGTIFVHSVSLLYSGVGVG